MEINKLFPLNMIPLNSFILFLVSDAYSLDFQGSYWLPEESVTITHLDFSQNYFFKLSAD